MALRRNQIQPARAFFEEAVTLNPDEAEHHAMLAWALWLTAGDKGAAHADVVGRFNHAIKLSPACVAAHFYRGLVAKQAGKDDAAIDSFRKVLDLDSNHQEASLELRLLLNRSGRRRESGGLLDKLKRR
jgi:cytochrome c-type biogenesis protein CcmH/NrfG